MRKSFVLLLCRIFASSALSPQARAFNLASQHSLLKRHHLSLPLYTHSASINFVCCSQANLPPHIPCVLALSSAQRAPPLGERSAFILSQPVSRPTIMFPGGPPGGAGGFDFSALQAALNVRCVVHVCVHACACEGGSRDASALYRRARRVYGLP